MGQPVQPAHRATLDQLVRQAQLAQPALRVQLAQPGRPDHRANRVCRAMSEPPVQLARQALQARKARRVHRVRLALPVQRGPRGHKEMLELRARREQQDLQVLRARRAPPARLALPEPPAQPGRPARALHGKVSGTLPPPTRPMTSFHDRARPTLLCRPQPATILPPIRPIPIGPKLQSRASRARPERLGQ